MGQPEVLAFLCNKRKARDDDYYSATQIAKMMGQSTRSVKLSLNKLFPYYVERRATQPKWAKKRKQFKWKHTFRARKVHMRLFD